VERLPATRPARIRALIEKDLASALARAFLGPILDGRTVGF
jgi:hypothetical protein